MCCTKVQDPKACSNIFNMHRDTEEDSAHHVTLYTVVILLRGDPKSTSMHVLGMEPFMYEGVGKGSLFVSKLWHETGFCKTACVKLTFFYGVLYKHVHVNTD